MAAIAASSGQFIQGPSNLDALTFLGSDILVRKILKEKQICTSKRNMSI